MFRTRLTVEKLISNPRRLMLSDDATLIPQQGDGDHDQAQPCILHVSYSTHYFKGDLQARCNLHLPPKTHRCKPSKCHQPAWALLKQRLFM